MNDPKLVPHIKSAQNMISQKTCKEIVWTKILQDFYSSTNRYMQIISISMALISSTKKQILKTAEKLGLFTVFQIFMIDTQAFGTGVRNAQKIQCDAIEIMPGAIPNIVREVCELVDRPVLCAGLVKTSEEVSQLLKAGARGIATSNTRLWQEPVANLSRKRIEL